MKSKFRGPSNGCGKGGRWHERFDRRGCELKAGRAEKSCRHVSDGVCDGIKKLQFVRCAGGCIGNPGDEELNEVSEGGMKVSRTFHSKWEENIGGKVMMFGVVGQFGVVCDLGSMRVTSFVAYAG